MVLSCYAVAGFLVRSFMHRLARRYTRDRRADRLAVPRGARLCLSAGARTRRVLLAVAAFTLGLALGSAQPLTIILTYNHAPAGRSGEALGMRIMANKVTQIGVPLLFGGLGAAMGSVPVFLATGALPVRRRPALAKIRQRGNAMKALSLPILVLFAAAALGAGLGRARHEGLPGQVVPQLPRHRGSGWRARRRAEARAESVSLRGLRGADAPAALRACRAIRSRCSRDQELADIYAYVASIKVASGEGHPGAARLARLADHVDQRRRAALHDCDRALQTPRRASRDR